jgi:phospholipid N-methyltransferase
VRHSYAIFLKEYFKNYREIGSVVPDSRRCLDALLKNVPFDNVNTIIEFGAASGALTREIIRRKKKGAALLAFEKNPVFFAGLQKKLAGEDVFLLNASVFESVAILTGKFGFSLSGVDCIVSTLPCSNIDVNNLLRECVVPLLNPRGVFIQYMHVISLLKGFHLRRILATYFHTILPSVVIGNIPPVIIYNCSSQKSPSKH